MIISQARKGQRLRIQRSGHCIGCSPKARLRASPQALEAVYEQERQSFLTVAIRQDAFGSGFQLSPTEGWSDSNFDVQRENSSLWHVARFRIQAPRRRRLRSQGRMIFSVRLDKAYPVDSGSATCCGLNDRIRSVAGTTIDGQRAFAFAISGTVF